MNVPDELICLFNAQIDETHDSYTIEIPKQEITTGALHLGEVYQTALLSTRTDLAANEHTTRSEPEAEDTGTDRKQQSSEPPVDEGDIREVDIDDIGDQGDGISRVERGFVVIVPETEKGERVTIEITEVKPNVAFGEVKERQTHF